MFKNDEKQVKSDQAKDWKVKQKDIILREAIS